MCPITTPFLLEGLEKNNEIMINVFSKNTKVCDNPGVGLWTTPKKGKKYTWNKNRFYNNKKNLKLKKKLKIQEYMLTKRIRKKNEKFNNNTRT